MGNLADRLKRNLNIYLRERMDFIAAVSTLDPTWIVPLDIQSDIIEPIWGGVKQSRPELVLLQNCPELFLLLDNIARSEGIRAAGLELNIKIIEKEGKEEFQYGFFVKDGEKPKYERRPDVSGNPHKLAIYLGTAGLQAFYVILENFIRNSAKHSLEKESVRKRSEAIIRLSSGSNTQEDRHAAKNNQPLRIFLRFEFDGSADFYEDYVKISLYDEMGGWDTIGRNVDNVISPKLDPTKSSGSLITEQGLLSEGAWGLKEMRICASFLRGLRIKDYDSIQPEDSTGRTVPVLQASQFHESLGYVFYMPKAKDLLIIGDLLPKYLQKSALKNQGIYCLNNVNELASLQDRGTFTDTFVVIDADDASNLEHFLDNIKQYPIRTFLLTHEKSRIATAIKIRTEANLCRQFLNHIIAKDQFNTWFASAKLKLSVEGRPVDISNFLESERLLLNVYRQWVELLNSAQDLPKVGVGYYDFASAMYEDEISFGFSHTDAGTETISVKDKVILSHGHDGFKIKEKTNQENIINEDAIRSCRFYAPYTTAPPNQLTMFAKSLTSFPSNVGIKVRSYFELLEASLANIIIIDERIFDDARHRRSFPGMDMHLFSYLYLQNVLILNLVKEKESSAENSKIDVQYYNLPQPLRAVDDLPRIRSTSLNSFQRMMSTAFPDFPNKIHFLIIHQTIVDKLSAGMGINQLLEAMGAYQPKWVVVTSGRGKPEREKIPSFARFIEFSNLRKYLVEKPDKILLMQMLYSLKEGRTK